MGGGGCTQEAIWAISEVQMGQIRAKMALEVSPGGTLEVSPGGTLEVPGGSTRGTQEAVLEVPGR